MIIALACLAVAATVAVRQRMSLRRIAARLEAVAARLAPAGAHERPRGATARIAHGLDIVANAADAIDHRLSHQHQLTGLPTREPLLARITADMDSGAAALLGIVELTDFERLTDFDGRLADRALVAIAERIARMVGPDRVVAQVDKAAIAVWFAPPTPIPAAHAELLAITYALADPIAVDGRDFLPVFRTGSAEAPRDGQTADALLNRATAALTALRADPSAGPGAIDPAEAARSDFRLEQDLRQAVAREELQLLFQPLIDGARQAVCGAEALLRWHHPQLGQIEPTRFVPILERAGLADEIGLWALNAACREAAGWQSRGLDALHVAVNISGRQLQRPDLRALIERTLARHRLPPELLEIELTETVATHDVPSTRVLFEQLRAIGVTIAIDDFGTGYSSLSYLKKLSFDKLKIDREFVTAVDTRRDSQAICQSIIALGRGLGIRVLAEGVERREEYEWLRRHGCVLFQGYYFARPLSADNFISFAADAPRIGRLTAVAAAALQTRLKESIAS